MHNGSHVVVFLGPPGCGKGTQASRLAPVLGIPAISTGEMLRRESQSGSQLGLAVREILSRGQLVSDDVMNEVVASRLREPDCFRGCILDGYPRTRAQARFLEKTMGALGNPKLFVFDFCVANEEIIHRLSNRRQCSACGRAFSVESGTESAVCDQDGSPLIRRGDDDPETVRRRLQIYEQNAWPLIDFYRKKNYHRVYAGRAPEHITAELLTHFESRPARMRHRAAFVAATA